MMTVHEVSKLTGVSIRALQYYDRIGLLKPAERTQAGYRMYGGADLERLQQILFFRELEFPLKEIARILEDPGFDRKEAVRDQLALLEMKKAHLDELILLARRIEEKGEGTLEFQAFDNSRMEEYAKKAKEKWGHTPEYREFEEKNRERSPQAQRELGGQLMEIFRRFGALRDRDPGCGEAQELVRQLQAFLTEHYYTCTKEVLAGLGKMYGAGGAFTQNIDKEAGEGTAVFASRAIAFFCEK